MRLFRVAFCVFVTCAVAGLRADEPKMPTAASVPQTSTESKATQTETIPKSAASPIGSPNAKTSDAERIAELRQTLEAEQSRLKELEAEFKDPASEYAKAEKAFQELDHELGQKRELLNKHKADGNADAAAILEKEIRSIEKQRQLAKERFELALEERKTLREEIATLRRKTALDQEALDELTGVKPKRDEESTSSRSDGSSQKKDADEKDSKSAPSKKSDGDETHNEKQDEDKAKSSDMSASEDAELKQAEDEAREKEEAAEEAQDETRSLAARIADLQKLIAQEQKVLALARKKVELSQTTQKDYEAELAKRQNESASTTELEELKTGVGEARQRLAAAQTEVAEATDRLNEHRSELAALQSEQILVLEEAEQARQAAEAAKEKVEELRNPFTLRNLSQWLLDHGPKVLLMVLGMFVLNQFSHFFSNRTIKLIAGGSSRGSPVERENRARTLVGVFQNASTVAIFIGGTLMILEECGANVTVLMGGVAVIGLAVAFGAQNLIKDYFSGFVMLLENQYMLNDTIRIGDVSGQVERITLRMTVLRDGSGVVHFIPNGTINGVSNETHGWSRAPIEVGVAYKENLDRVIAVLSELARELRTDKAFGPMILDDATQPAVEALGESAVTIKFSIKTKPNQQGAIKRELLRRIKNRFDELGIELPFPHRTLYHRYESMSEMPPSIGDMKKCA